MLRLTQILSASLCVSLISCGLDASRKSKPAKSSPVVAQGELNGGTEATLCTLQATPTVECPIISTPVQSGTVYGTPVIVAAPPVITYTASPSVYSRAVASTPMAVECIDAFIAQGYPDAGGIQSALFRSANTKWGDSIIGDYSDTQAQILIVIDLTSCKSKVELRLFNRNGFYCIVGNKAWASTVQIQRKCEAKLISLTPTTNTTFGRNTATIGSNGRFSSVEELPCIP